MTFGAVIKGCIEGLIGALIGDYLFFLYSPIPASGVVTRAVTGADIKGRHQGQTLRQGLYHIKGLL